MLTEVVLFLIFLFDVGKHKIKNGRFSDKTYSYQQIFNLHISMIGSYTVVFEYIYRRGIKFC